MTDAVAADLLELLRAHLRQPDLAYIEEPQHLAGGYYTDNRRFRVDAADPAWARPLVVRLFPREAGPQSCRREATVQSVLRAAGFPAADVLLVDDELTRLGRRFFIMELLPGRAAMGGAGAGDVVRSMPWIMRHAARVTAEIQAQLHTIDPTPILDELSDLPMGVDRYLLELERHVASTAAELAAALHWLQDNRPSETDRCICHGDLWPGNFLLEHGEVSGVLDWSVAAIAEPALDVGFTAMGLTIAPIQTGRALDAVITRVSGWQARRYVRAYAALTNADLRAQPYYEALRCALEFRSVIEYRRATAAGVALDAPPPTWDVAVDRMSAYFAERTGIRLTAPRRVCDV